MNQKLVKVQIMVNELAKLINAPTDLLPTYEKSKDFAHPHIELDNDGLYNYVVVERGQEWTRKATSDLNELLYWIYNSVTFSMASDYELKNRIEDKDARRIMFAKQEELLGILNENWREKQMMEHKQILERYPFDDLAGLRANYFRELREKGLPESEIEKLTYEKYPEK